MKSVLKFITCGSVDDGKSTLLGRLLFDTKNIFDDQMSLITSDKKKNDKIANLTHSNILHRSS